jgi:hypothetical protein
MSTAFPWDEIDTEAPALTDHGPRARSRSAAEPGRDTCVECGRAIGETGRWYEDGVGCLVPYCATCAELEFPIT